MRVINRHVPRGRGSHTRPSPVHGSSLPHGRVPGIGGRLSARLAVCPGCERTILDTFTLSVLGKEWHEKCVRCSSCRVPLTEKCFSRKGMLYCRRDFFRLFGKKCATCEEGIAPNELVRHVSNKRFHVKCFRCWLCCEQLMTGQAFHILDDGKLICKEDYINTYVVWSGAGAEGGADSGIEASALDNVMATTKAASPGTSQVFLNNNKPPVPFPANGLGGMGSTPIPQHLMSSPHPSVCNRHITTELTDLDWELNASPASKDIPYSALRFANMPPTGDRSAGNQGAGMPGAENHRVNSKNRQHRTPVTATAAAAAVPWEGVVRWWGRKRDDCGPASRPSSRRC